MLITPEYRLQQQLLHQDPNYGARSVLFAPLVAQIINKLEITDILDYGTGKMRLFEGLKGKVNQPLKVQAYDPGVLELSTAPVPSNMVTCIDVLEHVEPDCLDDVLDDLQRLTILVGFFSITYCPAKKTLPDGRNAHLIQEPPEWWLPKIMQRFDLQTFQMAGDSVFYTIVYAKQNRIVT